MSVPKSQVHLTAVEAAFELDGVEVLFEAHRAGHIQMIGRPVSPEGKNPGDWEIIPLQALLGGRRLNVLTGGIEADATSPDFQEFVDNLALSGWADVKVLRAEVSQHKTRMKTPKYQSNAEQVRCATWLRELMAASETPLKTRDEYFDDAKALFSTLSLRAFLLLWADTARLTARPKWTAPGRRKGKSNRHTR